MKIKILSFFTLLMAVATAQTTPDIQLPENWTATQGNGTTINLQYTGDKRVKSVHVRVLAPFTVSSTQKVYFSPGNLQYQLNTGTWRFAEHQWNYVGDNTNGNVYEGDIKCSNAKLTSYESMHSGNWIDLFGWGTSGHNGKYPYMISTTDADYGPAYSNAQGANNDITGNNAQYDWGVHNAISNGGNTAGLWRTLTDAEWTYLINSRTTSSGQRFAKAQVHGVIGLVLLPDNWNDATYTFTKTNTKTAAFESVTDNDWDTIEAAGAVFLPAAGARDGFSVSIVGVSGFYWSSSANEDGATYLYVSKNNNIPTAQVSSVYSRRHFARSVRLVRDVK